MTSFQPSRLCKLLGVKGFTRAAVCRPWLERKRCHPSYVGESLAVCQNLGASVHIGLSGKHAESSRLCLCVPSVQHVVAKEQMNAEPCYFRDKQIPHKD